MRKRIISIWLSVCIILTMFPISAMAEEVDTSIGTRVEIIAFAPLAETEKSVSTGTAIEDLGFPETLTATVRTAVAADSGTAEEPVQDSGNPDNLTEATPGSATSTGSGEQAKADETTEPEWNITTSDIPITWTAEPEYNGNENGDYVFKPVIEGYTVSAALPEIIVTVGTQLLMMALRTGTPATYGDFSVSIDEDGATPTFDDSKNTLTFSEAGEYTVGMAGGNDSTSDVIVVNTTGEVKLNLDGVVIEAPNGSSAVQDGATALTVTSGSVTLNVIADSSLTGGMGNPSLMEVGKSGAGISGNITVMGTATLTSTGGKGGSSEGETGGEGGAGVNGNVTVKGAATLTATGGAAGAGYMNGRAGFGIRGNVDVSGTATLIAVSGSGAAGMAISNASGYVGGTIAVEDGYIVKVGDNATAAADCPPLPHTELMNLTSHYIIVTPPAAPSLPTAAEYAAASPAAAYGTDYVLDGTNKTLTIKTTKGAAWWSANGASYLDYTVLLADDINVSAFLWTPVGNGSGVPFTGSFDGQGHSISGLTITAANESYAALFGGTSGAAIQNLCVSGTIEVTETNNSLYIGGIAGCLNNSIIRNCCSHVNISGAASYVNAGGIVGLLNSGTIENCFNTGNISGDATAVAAGGICGAIGDQYANAAIGIVKNSYNTGSVTGSGLALTQLGALGGYVNNGKLVLENGRYLYGTASAAFGSGSSASNDANSSSFTEGEADDLLAALNGWVAATASTSYYTWQADSATPVNGGYPVFGAAWTSPVASSTFNFCNGAATASVKPTEPTWAGTGYTFAGWYTMPNGEGTELTGDGDSGTTYYAKWMNNGKTVRTTALDLTDIGESKLYGSTKNGDVYTNTDEDWIWYAVQTTVGSETYAANTLVLSGLTLNTTADTALKVPSSATIVLGDGKINTIQGGNATAGAVYGIYGVGALTVNGGGTLSVTAGDSGFQENDQSTGIFSSGALAVNGGTITSISGKAAESYGMMSVGALTIDSDAVISAGGLSVAGGGIFSLDNLTITGGTIAGSSDGMLMGYGLFATGEIAITGDTVTGNGGGLMGCGIFAEEIAITDGTVIATNNAIDEDGNPLSAATAIEATTTLTIGSTAKPATITNATDGTSAITASSGTVVSKKLVMSSSDAVVISFATYYAITENTATNGSFTVKVNGSAVTAAQSNETVTVIPTANSGYKLDTITVCKTGDSSTTVTVTNSNTFTMPAYAVTVNVTFKVSSVPVYTISGTIKGSDTSSGIPASLQLKDGGGNVLGTTTAAANGSYSFTSVSAGNYTIPVSYTGYDSGTITGVTVSNANITGQNLTLTKSISGLTDAQKLAAAKVAIMAAINQMPFSNSTTAADILSVAQAASLYGVTVTWDSTDGFTKTQATTSAKGSIRGTLKLELNDESGGIGIDATIAKLSTGGDNGGGGSNGGGSTTPPSTKPTEPVTGSTENKATVDGKGNASVSLTDKNITDAIADAKAEAAKKGVNAGDITAVIHVTTDGKDANTVTVNLPKTTQEQVIGNKIASVQLVIDRPDLTIGINLAAVTEINRQAKADVQLSATRMDNTKLSGDAKAAIGNRPAYDLKALYGSGKSVTDFGKGSVSVEIPYTLQKGEITGNVYAVYVDAKGKVTYLTDSSYDAKRGTVVFSTSHFSTYGVAYKASFNFTDIAGHWAKDDILFVANRGLMTGTSATTFSPNGSMTRGMFATALGRLANADISAYKQSSFTDVKADAYYMGYIEWGVKNNILVGIGGGKFNPDGLVTREQMAVIMDRYATSIGFKLPEVHTQNVFADNAKIGAWAAPSVKRVQMAGIIQGKSNNLYDPQGTATRAEVSAVLRRFVEVAIFSDTAQGWTMNDSGKWMYYENGKPVIGKTVQKGDSFWSIARKLDCTMSELERLNNKSRFSIIHPGDVLRVPEK